MDASMKISEREDLTVKRQHHMAWMSVLIAALAGPALASEPIIYPAKGQSAEQQKRDVMECKQWAQDTTGIDPSAPAEKFASTTDSGGGKAVGGAIKGAAAGAIVGEVADGDAGKGAAAGATIGILAGGAKRRQQQQAQQQALQQALDKRNADMATYGRARNACMEGRGYVLK